MLGRFAEVIISAGTFAEVIISTGTFCRGDYNLQVLGHFAEVIISDGTLCRDFNQSLLVKKSLS